MHCKKIAPLTYAKCGNENVNAEVKHAINQFKNSVVAVGPGLFRGVLTLAFYEKRESKGFLGLSMLTTQEKVYFEKWRFSILVNENPLDCTDKEYRRRVYEAAREEIKQRMLCIFENANGPVDHVPTSGYDFEMVCVVDDR